MGGEREREDEPSRERRHSTGSCTAMPRDDVIPNEHGDGSEVEEKAKEEERGDDVGREWGEGEEDWAVGRSFLLSVLMCVWPNDSVRRPHERERDERNEKRKAVDGEGTREVEDDVSKDFSIQKNLQNNFFLMKIKIEILQNILCAMLSVLSEAHFEERWNF
jgi:hypothetical protein